MVSDRSTRPLLVAGLQIVGKALIHITRVREIDFRRRGISRGVPGRIPRKILLGKGPSPDLEKGDLAEPQNGGIQEP